MATNDFNPNFKSKHVAPHAGNDGATDFPMDEVLRRLDGDAEPEPLEDSTQPDAAQVMRMLLEWIVDVRANDSRGLSPIATRTLACVWVIRPDIFGNVAGRMVARAYGISYQKFSEHAADFSRQFNIRNRFQDHDAKHKK